MVLVERMVLLLIEMAPNNCMTEANLLLVLFRDEQTTRPAIGKWP